MFHRVFSLTALSVLTAVLAGCAGLGAPAATPTPEPTTTPTNTPAPTSTPEPSVFRIIPEQSEARFIIDETLLKEGLFTVVGVTSLVEGDIMADYANPAAAQIGVIRIDLEDLKTDDPLRNNSLRLFILNSNLERYKYGEFVTTELVGLPDTVTIGEPFEFEIVGDLTVHGVTVPVTFVATVTPISETRLEGHASTEINYKDFGLAVGGPVSVLSVEEEVILELDFVAETN